MKEFWKRVKRFLLMKSEDLSPAQQKGFLMVDLLMIAFLLWAIWISLGSPLPTAEMEFRRLERTHLLPRSEIVFAGTRREKMYGGEDGLAVSMRQPAFLGIAGERVAAAACGQGQWRVDSYPLEDGPTPAPFADAHAVLYEPESRSFVFPLMFVNAPEEAARAELAFRQLYQETSHQWSGQGWNTGNGTWLFPVQTPLTAYGEYWWRGGGYTLALYRADGALLLEKSGTLGE